MLEEEKGNLPCATGSVERKSGVDAPPIFIIGTGRSGTSLLRAMLNAHPRIWLLQEAMFFPMTGWLPPWVDGRRRLEFYLRSLTFAWLGVDTGDIRRRFPAPLPRARLPEVYAHLMREVARRHGKPRGGDKSPLNSAFIGAVLEAFPGAPVIDMVRDPRAVAWSHAGMPWSTSSLSALGLMLRRHEKLLAPWGDRVLRIRLEDLAAEPRATMSAVLDFVGEPWDDAVMDTDRVAQRDDGQPYPWLAVRPLAGGAGPVAGWREGMPPVWIRWIERCTREMMARFGYPPAALAVEPTHRELARAILQDLPAIAQAVTSRARVARRITRKRALPLAEIQRISFDLNPRAWGEHPDWILPDAPEPND